MAASQLTLYNDALLLAGERFLASLTEEREPRRLLDRVWANDAVKACLEMGQWTFAMRGAQFDYDTNIEPSFGYPRAFEKPSDWVLTSAVCADEYFQVPLTRYVDEAGYWYSDVDTIYVRYVSNDAAYGGDYTAWPNSFTEVVAEYLCSRIVRKLTGSESAEVASLKRLDMKLTTAKNRAAMAGPTTFPARGSWVRARTSGYGGGDGGNTSGSLIG